MQNQQTWTPLFHRLADAAGTAILPHFRADLAIDNKYTEGFDPVTEADRAAERAIRAILGAELPDHGILGEEYGAERLDSDYVWVLDPIDGTRAFISGIPVWGTLIGLKHKGRAAIGMMAQPFTGERFLGDGRSAGYSGPDGARPLRTRKDRGLGEATLMTTSPKLFAADKRPAYERVEEKVRLARYGCDCYAYCMLAMGLVDIVIESGLHPYDIVALIPIIEGAGGVVVTWDGGRPEDGGDILALGNPDLLPQVRRLLAG